VCGDEGPTAIWDVTHQRLAVHEQRLYAGGMFSGIDGVLSEAIAAYDGTTWLAQGTSGAGVGGSIDRIAAGGTACEVYGVGSFTHVGGQPATGRVVHWNGGGWDMLSDTLPQDAFCPAFDVGPSGQAALGCMVFPPVGGAEGKILSPKGSAMEALETPGLGPVMALEWSPSGTLWIAGGADTGYLARIDGDSLTVVEDGFDGQVGKLDVLSDSDITVAGLFSHVDALAAERIAHWDGSQWAALGAGVKGQVLALERDAGKTYISSYDDGSGAYLLGAFDGTGWQELAGPGSNLTVKQEFSFNAIRAVGDALVVVGSPELDDQSGRSALIYRDGKFSALAGGVSAISVDAIALTNDSLWLAGPITAVGTDSAISSVGIARYLLKTP
jgi:hypothetical protein